MFALELVITATGVILRHYLYCVCGLDIVVWQFVFCFHHLCFSGSGNGSWLVRLLLGIPDSVTAAALSTFWYAGVAAFDGPPLSCIFFVSQCVFSSWDKENGVLFRSALQFVLILVAKQIR